MMLHLKLLLINLLVATVKAQNEDYRLSNSVVPTNYILELTVQSDFGVTGTFQGTATIHLTALQNTSTFEIHGSGLTITSNTLTTSTSTSNILQTITYNSTTEKHTITTSTPLSTTTPDYVLTISYNGILYDDMYGFYRSWYTSENGTTTWIATTQFQPTYARRAFPCFDEPNKKAVYEISIVRPTTLRSLTNTPLRTTTSVREGFERDTFEETPRMSTYHVAFIVSDYASINDPIHRNAVWSRREAIGDGDYSFQVAPRIVDAFNQYTNIPYLSSGIGKLDQVAIPDFGAGAMENWGLITYREYAILWDPEESSHSYKQTVATTVAHELAHMWFGNLVTCDWWSYTWLNEGFAQYMQYIILSQVETTWDLQRQFVINLVQGIFGSDSTTSSRSLNAEAYTPSEVSYKFATTTYYKGASIIRMLRDFVGADNFRDALRSYLSTYSRSTTIPEYLWNAMETYSSNVSLPANISTIMSTWTDQPGFPVVNVSLTGATTVTLTQQRFLLNNSVSSDLQYYVPISYTNSESIDFNTVAPAAWLLPNSQLQIPNAVSNSGWIIVNVQESGFYRVNYDSTLWARIVAVLRSSIYYSIDVLNRAQLIDDSMNLARAGILPYSTALEVTSYLSSETEYYPWYSAIEAFSHLRIRSANLTPLRTHLENYILSLISPVYETLAFEYDPNESQANILKKVRILDLACELGMESCVSQAQRLFVRLRDNDFIVPSDLRSVVYCTALRTMNDTDNWYFLWNKYLNSKLATEANTILSALGCTRDNALRTEYLTMSITRNSGIRSQDSRSVFQSIYLRNLDGINLAYNFFKDNFQNISSYYGGGTSLGTIISGMADRFTTESQISDFETFIAQHESQLGGALSAARGAVESARANVAWMDSYSDSILQWFVTNYNSGSTTISSFSFLLFVITTFSILFVR